MRWIIMILALLVIGPIVYAKIAKPAYEKIERTLREAGEALR